MSIFAGICIGIVVGTFLGGVGVFLLIKETALDAVLERRAEEEDNFTFLIDGEKIGDIKSELKRDTPTLAPDIEEDTLEMPQEVNYDDV